MASVLQQPRTLTTTAHVQPDILDRTAKNMHVTAEHAATARVLTPLQVLTTNATVSLVTMATLANLKVVQQGRVTMVGPANLWIIIHSITASARQASKEDYVNAL